jgi:DNA-binding MarR family transcriptional regulator
VQIRRGAHDARVTEVELTSAGHEAVQVIRGVASRMYRAAFGDFSPGEIQGLNAALARVHRNLLNGG